MKSFIVACCVLVGSSAMAVEGIVAEGETLQKLGTGMAFTEGPVWVPSTKTLVFSDIPASKLMQWREGEGVSEFRSSKHPNGNLLDLEGRLLTCQHSGRAVVRTEKDGTIKVLVDNFEGKKLNSPNDLAVKSDGTIWFTDPPWGLRGKPGEIDGHWVYRLDPDGALTVVTKSLAMPNGIAFSLDEKRLFVADTGGHPSVKDPAKRNAPPKIHVFNVTDTNTLSEKISEIDVWCDGMTMDEKGNLYAGNHDGIRVFDPEGKELGLIKVPEKTTNSCFGGEDYKTLFITARKSLYAIKLDVKGAKPKNAKW